MHGVHQAQAVLHAGLADEVLDLVGDVDVVPAVGGLEPEFLPKVLHAG